MAWAEEEDGDAAEVCRLVRTCGRTDRQTGKPLGWILVLFRVSGSGGERK